MAAAIFEFVKASEARGFFFANGKLTVAASRMELAHNVAKKLNAWGIPHFQAAAHVRDVGVDTTGRKRRILTVRNARLKGGKRRLEFIKQLANTSY